VPGADQFKLLDGGAPSAHTPIDVTLSGEAGSHELALQRKAIEPPPLRRDLGEGQTWTRMWRWKKMRREMAGRQEFY